jgi:hypothetical protein
VTIRLYVTTAQIAWTVTEAVVPPVKAAVVTAVACHPVAVGIDERKVIRVALAPEVGVIDPPPPSGTLPVGQFTLAATLVPFAGFAAVVVVACTT